jgi:hypothetical protein
MAKSSKSNSSSFRSAKTGRFVKESYAKKHPSTTVKENNKKTSGKKK